MSNLCPLFSSSYLNWNTNVAIEIQCDHHWSLVASPIQRLQVKHEDRHSKIELKRALRSPFLYLPSSFVTATGKVLFGGRYKTVRSHRDAFIPYNLTSKKERSRNPQCGSKNRVCWYKEMRPWWTCNQNLPRRILTMAASFSCLCELRGATGFEGAAQRGRSKAVQPDGPASCLSAPDCIQRMGKEDHLWKVFPTADQDFSWQKSNWWWSYFLREVDNPEEETVAAQTCFACPALSGWPLVLPSGPLSWLHSSCPAQRASFVP